MLGLFFSCTHTLPKVGVDEVPKLDESEVVGIELVAIRFCNQII